MEEFKRHVWISVGIIVLSFAAAGGFVALGVGSVNDKATRIAQERSATAEQAALVGALAGFKKIAPQVEAYEAKLAEIVPSKDRLLDFPRWIAELSRLNQVTVKFSFHGSAVAPEPGTLGHNSFGLTAVGNRDDLAKFFSSLEFRSPKFFVQIVNYEITEQGEGYQVAAEGKVFFK
jgi:hypothetical protein